MGGGRAPEPTWAAAQRRTEADKFFGAQRPRGAARKHRRGEHGGEKTWTATVSEGPDPPIGLQPRARRNGRRTATETAFPHRVRPCNRRSGQGSTRAPSGPFELRDTASLRRRQPASVSKQPIERGAQQHETPDGLCADAFPILLGQLEYMRRATGARARRPCAQAIHRDADTRTRAIRQRARNSLRLERVLRRFARREAPLWRRNRTRSQKRSNCGSLA
jgi:hypothetical protein